MSTPRRPAVGRSRRSGGLRVDLGNDLPPAVVVLGAGEVLVRGAALERLEQATRYALRLARRGDGYVPPDLPPLYEALCTALGRQRATGSAHGTPELPAPAVEPPSADSDLVEVAEVVRIAGVSEEYARRLCRGRFTTARLNGRRWVVDRIEVETWAEQRAARRARQR